MPTAFVGQRVLTPKTALTNGGVDFAVAHITEVVDTDPTVIINIQVINNTLLTPSAYVTNVEFFDYEDDARTAGIGNGAWPLDYP